MANQTHHFAAADSARVVLETDNVGDNEAKHVRVVGGLGELVGVGVLVAVLPLVERHEEGNRVLILEVLFLF